MQEVVLTFSERMRIAVAAGSDYGGLHFGRSRWDRDYQPKCWTREQGAAAVVAAEERPRILVWLLPARRATMGVCWTSGVWLGSGRTAWSAGAWFPFPIIIPNPKSEIEANAQMLEQVMYLLMMEVISPGDTRTRWTYAAKIWQTLTPHLSWHPKGIREEERFWLEEHRKRVRGCDRVPGREEPPELRGSMKSRKERRMSDCSWVWTTELSIQPQWRTDILPHRSRRCSTGPQECVSPNPNQGRWEVQNHGTGSSSTVSCRSGWRMHQLQLHLEETSPRQSNDL